MPVLLLRVAKGCFVLGLLAATGGAAAADRAPAAEGSIYRCDLLAASSVDPDLPANVRGVDFHSIDAQAALAACGEVLKLQTDNPRAAFQYGRTLDSLGRVQEAAKFYEQAANQGYAAAQYGLGLLRLDGRGVPKDEDDAYHLILLAAGQDHAAAIYTIGHRYRFGKGVEVDYAKATYWYRRGAMLGYLPCMTSYADMSYYGLGIPQNYREALDWFTTPASYGDTLAQVRLARIYEKGLGTPVNLPHAAYWYRQAAEAGDAFAQSNLGYLHSQGLGVEEDMAEAAHWLRLAADQGDGFAQVALGNFFYDGTGVHQDYEQAVRLFRLAADQGDSSAQAMLGVAHIFGRGVPFDYHAALEWNLMSAATGNAQGIYGLGLQYFWGWGVPIDRVKGARLMYAGFIRGDYWANDALLNPENSDHGATFRSVVQQLLIEDGYYDGAVSGEFDHATIAALRAAYNTASAVAPFDVNAMEPIRPGLKEREASAAGLPSCPQENCS